MKHFLCSCSQLFIPFELSFVSTVEGKASEWALLKRHPEENVFGIQIAAAHPDQFTRVAELIEAHTDVDFVDLNLGCPLDLVCSKGAGAQLMMREKKLKGALEGISSVLSCPITVKMRTGWDMAHPFAHQLVPKIQSWGIDGIAAIMVSATLKCLLLCKLSMICTNCGWWIPRRCMGDQGSNGTRNLLIGIISARWLLEANRSS